MAERETPEGLSPLRYKVDMLLKDYHAESVLQMLVHAIEDLGPCGALDEEGVMPRAGNWCGIYTSLMTPVVLTLDIPKNRRKLPPKKKWFSRASKA
jgi:hypothetical protein